MLRKYIQINEIIYHLFSGDTYFLSLRIINSIISYSNYRHYFFISINDISIKNKYLEMFEKIQYIDYEFIEPKRLDLKSKLQVIKFKLNNFTLNKHIALPCEDSIYSFMLNYRYENIVIHGELNMYGDNLVKLFKLINIRYVWVCWGGVPMIVKHKYLHRLTRSYHIELFLKKSFQNITLTEKDKKNLFDVYGGNNITFCPYIPRKEEYIPSKRLKNRILIGNSGHYLREYRGVLSMLKHLEGLEITFMVNYGIVDLDDYLLFKEECILLKNNIKIDFWEEVVSIEQYEAILKEYAVYICNVERQSGLGAANHAFNYGLKVFLTGVNYEHYANAGFVVHDVNELIHLRSVQELFYISDKEIVHNLKSLNNFLDINKSSTLWDEIYGNMLSDDFDS